MTKKVNQIILNAPAIPSYMKFQVDGYLFGRHTRKCTIPFESWSHLDFKAKSDNVYHVLGNGTKFLVVSIQMKDEVEKLKVKLKLN